MDVAIAGISRTFSVALAMIAIATPEISMNDRKSIRGWWIQTCPSHQPDGEWATKYHYHSLSIPWHGQMNPILELVNVVNHKEPQKALKFCGTLDLLFLSNPLVVKYIIKYFFFPGLITFGASTTIFSAPVFGLGRLGRLTSSQRHTCQFEAWWQFWDLWNRFGFLLTWCSWVIFLGTWIFTWWIWWPNGQCWWDNLYCKRKTKKTQGGCVICGSQFVQRFFAGWWFGTWILFSPF